MVVVTGMPRSEPPAKVTVGQRRAGGQVSVWLEPRNPREPDRVGVNTAQMTGISVSISRAQAVELYHGLGRLLGLE